VGNGENDVANELTKPTDTERTILDALEEVAPLVEAADKGDRAAMAELRIYLDTHPTLWDDLERAFGRAAETAWLNQVSAGSLFHKEGWGRALAKIRSDLSGPDPSPIEKMLINRVCVCWLYLQGAEMLYAHAASGSYLFREAEHLDKRVERAQRRYLSALKTLAQVRQLEIPRINQLNVGAQQVNLADAQFGLERGRRGLLPGHAAATSKGNAGLAASPARLQREGTVGPIQHPSRSKDGSDQPIDVCIDEEVTG
jgi:hypothetical protein